MIYMREGKEVPEEKIGLLKKKKVNYGRKMTYSSGRKELQEGGKMNYQNAINAAQQKLLV